tara:strand:+ start:3272 stop:4255 length:984 start_codon:yes stop_codon:yes gene_type:complete
MLAWQMNELGDPWDKLTLAEIPAPRPGPGTVHIRVEATDVNFADILQCQGGYQVRLDPPFTPGMTAGGVVIAAGDGTDFKTGDRVVGHTLDVYGGYAQESILEAEFTYKVPEDVPLEAASGIHITHATSWFALYHRGRLQPGETLLVLAAAGGVGSSAVQMAKAHGCRVIAAAGGSEKTAFCRELGADEVIDYRDEDLYARVMDLTDGRGVDVVYDPVGGEYFDIARRLVAWEGRLLVVGFASGTIPSAPANHTLVKNYDIVGVHMGGYRGRDNALLRTCYQDLHEQIASGKVTPIITEQAGLNELPQTLKKLANRETLGRLLFVPG